MNVFIIPIQSVSDIITNSSSELFILSTNKACEEVNNILETFTEGFDYPEVFSLKDYREWRKKYRKGEIEEAWSYPGSIFSIANGWFKDPEDEEDVYKSKLEYLYNPFVIEYFLTFESIRYIQNDKPVHIAYIKYLNNHWDLIKDNVNDILKSYGKQPISSINWSILLEHSYDFIYKLKNITKEFLNNYDGVKPKEWDIPEDEDVTKLDGTVIVVGGENEIPYEDFEKINKLFNGWNKHLG